MEKLFDLVSKYPNDASLGEMLRRFVLVNSGIITDNAVAESVDSDFDILKQVITFE